MLLSEMINSLSSSVRLSVSPGVNPRYVDDNWKRNAHKWTCKLSYQGHVYTVPFFMGQALTNEPTLSDVLPCLIEDARSFDLSGNAEEYACNVGLMDNYEHAEQLFNACGRTKRNLLRLLGDDLYNSLMDAENDI